MFRDFVLAGILCAATGGNPASAQGPEATVLVIDLENLVQYNSDVFDASKFASDPNPATAVAVAKNFGIYVQVGDIAAVNGKPAKGTFVVRGQLIFMNPTPSPGQGVADIVRNAVSDYLLEIQQTDGTQVGCIYGVGFSGGTAPVGAPSALQVSNLAVVGGTGAFVGARGQFGGMLYPGVVGSRTASVTEDPANRRINGGGRLRAVVHLIPMTRPEIAATATGPAIFHPDFSPVTAARPARAGQTVIVRATGLGPTRPGVNPGQPFPLDSVQEVNSPVEVTVGGLAAEVVNKVGWPGSIENYRVDVRLPEGMPAGLATLQLTAAWVPGASAQIPIQ
jgi:uncharacterized protein (TIGR03437 family)